MIKDETKFKIVRQHYEEHKDLNNEQYMIKYKNDKNIGKIIKYVFHSKMGAYMERLKEYKKTK